MLCSEAGNLFDKLYQSFFIDCAVRSEFAEPVFEVFIVVAFGITHVCELFLHTMLGLLLVESASAIEVVLMHHIVRGFPQDKVDLGVAVSHDKPFLFFA